MQEKNRESSKRSQKSRSDGRRVSKKNSIKSKSREYNPVEKRNQRIEKNKKISSRRNNSSKEHLSPKTKKYDNRQKTKIKKEVGSNISNKLAPKTTLKKSGDGNPVSRKSLNLFFYKNFRHPNYGYFGVGLIFACLILLFSSFDVVISKGLFFIYLGVLLLKQPRIYSQGIFIDFVTIGIVFFGLVTYLADLANYFSDMNINALGQNGADALLFIILSFKNLEVITILTTSILFYYHIQSWKLNKSGEGFLFLILAVIPILVGFVQYFKINSGLNYLVREDNLFSAFITEQLELFKDVEDELIIAYEPIWAIGSGITPTIADINEVSELIKGLCGNVKVLYGGSVNKENASNLLNNSNIDGVLVGGASLDPKEFANIAQSC